MTWQPIETCPRDETAADVLFYDEHDAEFHIGGWHPMGWWWTGNFKVHPTHWMPLPPPPATGEAG